MSYIIGDREIDAIAKIIKDGNLDRYIKGKDSISSRFEKNFSKAIGVSNTLAVSSGTTALMCALIGVGIRSGDQVIIPAYTYIATALAVLAVGAIPVIVDIDESLTISPTDISRKITSLTKAIIPVHMHGLPCDMDKIMKIAQENNLSVIEDVAQACGGSYRNQRLGSIGDVGAFSFNHYKMITCGEGGALTTNKQSVFDRAVSYHHGGYIFEPSTSKDPSALSVIGTNFRISEISSAMLEVQLTRLDDIIKQLRREKNFILHGLSDLENPFVFPLCHDVNGECARTVFFQFDNRATASEFVLKGTEKGVDLWFSDTKGHIYQDWIQLLKHNTEFCHVNLEINALKHSNENLECLSQKSLDILQSTVGMHVGMNRSNETLERLILELSELSQGLSCYA